MRNEFLFCLGDGGAAGYVSVNLKKYQLTMRSALASGEFQETHNFLIFYFFAKHIFDRSNPFVTAKKSEKSGIA